MKCGETTGRLNKKGQPCGCKLNGGKCPTHDTDVSARNRKVATVAAKCQSRRDQLATWGARGFAEAARRYGPDWAYKRLVAWKRVNLSQAEQQVFDFLKASGVKGLRLEYEVFNETFSSRVDLALPRQKKFVQVDGWRHLPGAFGLDETTLAREAARYDATWQFMERHRWQGLELRYNSKKGGLEPGWQEKALSFFGVGNVG